MTTTRDCKALYRSSILLAASRKQQVRGHPERGGPFCFWGASHIRPIWTAERELDRLRHRRADLETGRGTSANHPLDRDMLDHERAKENVARLRETLTSGRLPRRDRRTKETERV